MMPPRVDYYIYAARQAIDAQQFRLADAAIALICGYQVFCTALGDQIAPAPGRSQIHPIHGGMVDLPHYTTRISGAALLYFAAPFVPIDSTDPIELVEVFLSEMERCHA